MPPSAAMAVRWLGATAILLVLTSASSWPARSQQKCPQSNCSAAPLCSPRRCCGRRDAPVLGGVDLVDLYTCVQREGEPSSPKCLPTSGDPQFSAVFGGYTFLFMSEAHLGIFLKEPQKYVPRAGGFCAFSLTGFDNNGAGFWCACAKKEEGYAYVNGTAYFFLFSGAKDSFLRRGEAAVTGMATNWADLLAENDAEDLQCFNTERMVPHAGSANHSSDSCDMMSCLSFMDCHDCAGR